MTTDPGPVEAGADSARPGAVPDPRRWKALGVLALIQFMLVLDVTVVNVALPRIQHDLDFSKSGLAWVVNGYVLMAGGLLLLGGRLADMLGRRRHVPARRRGLRDRVCHLRRRRRPRHARRLPLRPGHRRGDGRAGLARSDRAAVPRPAGSG